MSEGEAPREWPVAALFGAIATIVLFDLAADLSDGVPWDHALVEGVTLALALAGVGTAIRRLRAERAQLAARLGTLRADRTRLEEAAARWRAEAEQAARGFAEAVEGEFARWELTPAEREIALFLLKGLSLKEIAAARGTSERTVRQQATVVYAKAGVAGRSELASYFLDVLPGPADDAGLRRLPEGPG